jgi:two-component system nitrogen regulation sensor histidine kinase GlnL
VTSRAARAALPPKRRISPDPNAILESLTTAIVVLDDNLVVTFISLAAQDLFGLSARQAIGQPLAKIIRPADELVALCRRTLATRLTFGLREFAVWIAGREVSLDCRAAPLEKEGGLLLELTDTEHERALRREAELVAQQKVSRRIVRQLAHEVKNPLGGLRGAAQLLERQLPSSELKAYTRVIIDEADRLAALVDSVLGTRGARVPEELNLHRITEHVASLIEAEKPAGVAVTRDYDPSLPPVLADRNQLIQAFLNIARNAMQAVGERGHLVFRTRVLSNFVIGGVRHRLVVSAEIEDDGPGIADEIKETIFYPLVTGKPTGTGIGLTIAQDLTSANGGLIEFTSRPGCTVFRIRIPAVSSHGGGAR